MEAAELFLEAVLLGPRRRRFDRVASLDHFRADHGAHRYLHPAHQHENDHRGTNRLDRAQLPKAQQAGNCHHATYVTQQMILGEDIADYQARLLAR